MEDCKPEISAKSKKAKKSSAKKDGGHVEALDTSCLWDVAEVLSERLSQQSWAVCNTMRLLDDDNTVPFIARYRKEMTNNMEADKIRELKDMYEELKTVQSKIDSVMKTIAGLGKLSTDLKVALRSSQSIEEVDHLYAPFKTGSKRSLAERARELGLEPLAIQVSQNPSMVNLNAAIKPGTQGLNSAEEVREGVQHIIADMISKDKDVMDIVRKLCQDSYVKLESTKSRSANKVLPNNVKGKDSDSKGKKTTNVKVKQEQKLEKGPSLSEADIKKFELYFNFSCPVRNVKPHQVLAINRGEHLKILTVKVNIPDKVKYQLNEKCFHKWARPDANGFIRKLVGDSIEDAYKRLIEPLLSRQIRSGLTKMAEKASIEVFGSNLKRLLLTPPVRGKRVMGVDPGYKNGCKYAVTSKTGKILNTGVSYLHTSRSKQEGDKFKQALLKYRCETVAIGNGTACRETEAFFSDLIKSGELSSLNLKYCIVSESGASIYSASDVAKAEMPELDINLRSAVSIARRLQDPLVELVKIDPKHIGVGMYQHDMPEAQLKSALDGVVEDCVSFVGVDINVCGEMMLRRIAGMSSTRAKKVIEWREAHGPFKNRQQLKSVKGLGPKTFNQCVGFIRIMPGTRNLDTSMSASFEKEVKPEVKPEVKLGLKRAADSAKNMCGKSKKAKIISGSNDEPNPLDMTCIHPESYTLAVKIMKKAGILPADIGSESAITSMRQFMKTTDEKKLSEELGAGVPTVQLIVNGLQQTVDHDIREEFEKPLFKQGMTSMNDLKPGAVLTGRVGNTTHFGSFVDIGVGRDGLIHVSKMPRSCMGGKASLDLGDRVEVRVDSIDQQRGRIGLQLVRLL